MLGRRAVVDKYSYEKLKQSVDQVIAECDSATWSEFARCLNWYMQWDGELFRG